MGTRNSAAAAHKVSVRKPHKYRLVMTWPNNPRPYRYSTNDKARARRLARQKAKAGAHVDFQVHDDWNVYNTTHTYTPPETTE